MCDAHEREPAQAASLVELKRRSPCLLHSESVRLESDPETGACRFIASVVSREARTLRTVEAQVRLLPEALSYARSSEDERRLARAGGRWFDSSRAYFAAA